MLINETKLDIKLADFGLAVKLSPIEEFKRIIGTPEYVGELLCNFLITINLFNDLTQHLYASTLLNTKSLFAVILLSQNFNSMKVLNHQMQINIF